MVVEWGSNSLFTLLNYQRVVDYVGFTWIIQVLSPGDSDSPPFPGPRGLVL